MDASPPPRETLVRLIERTIKDWKDVFGRHPIETAIVTGIFCIIMVVIAYFYFRKEFGKIEGVKISENIKISVNTSGPAGSSGDSTPTENSKPATHGPQKGNADSAQKAPGNKIPPVVGEKDPPPEKADNTLRDAQEQDLEVVSKVDGKGPLTIITVSDDFCPGYTRFSQGEIEKEVTQRLGKNPRSASVAVTAGYRYITGEGSSQEIRAYARYRICDAGECKPPQLSCNIIPICSFSQSITADVNRKWALGNLGQAIKKDIKTQTYIDNQSYIGEIPCP